MILTFTLGGILQVQKFINLFPERLCIIEMS